MPSAYIVKFLELICVKFSVTYPEIVWGDQFQKGCDAPLWVQGKALVGTMEPPAKLLEAP